MARGEYKIASGPYKAWVLEVDEHNRVRLPLEITDIVRWLTREPGTTECIGSLGPMGGIQLEPIAIHEALWQDFTSALGDTSPNYQDSNKKWVDVARLLATSWRMTVTVEKSQIRITLPEPVRRAKQLPESGGTVVVFSFGQILEIWDATRWSDHVRSLSITKTSVIAAAVEDLGK